MLILSKLLTKKCADPFFFSSMTDLVTSYLIGGDALPLQVSAMSQVVLELAVHLHEFRNLDLYRRGYGLAIVVNLLIVQDILICCVSLFSD